MKNSSRSLLSQIVLLSCVAANALGVANATPIDLKLLGKDIGEPALAGSESLKDGVLTIKGGGSDIWNAQDHFHYVYQAITGDFSLVTRAISIVRTDDWPKGGPMIRETLAPESPFVNLLLTGGNGVSYQYRNADHTTCGADNADGNGNVWLKLVRRGASVTGFVAPNKDDAPAEWVQIGGEQTVKEGAVYVGLCATAHTDDALTTLVVDHIAVEDK